MKKNSTVILAALGLVALGSGCAVEMDSPEENVGTNGDAVVCSNDGATFAVLAGAAVASANEIKRWLPQRDFECTTNMAGDVGVDVLPSGAPDGLVDYPGKCIRQTPAGTSWRMWTSPKGRAKCPNSNCRNLHAILRLQDNGEGMIFGGQALNQGTFRSRLYSYWQRQFTCINAPDNHDQSNCPVEAHELAKRSYDHKVVSNTTCDGGYDFWYTTWKANTTPPVSVPLQYPFQLKNMLLWAGGTDNPFLAFVNNGQQVKLDPVGGTAEDSSATSGSCTVVSYNASLNRCGSVYSATSLVGQCCQCNGVNKTFVAAPQLDYYKCQ